MKTKILFSLIICLFLLVACNNKKEEVQLNENVHSQELNSSKRTDPKIVYKLIEEEEIKVVRNNIDKAVKIEGIVNMNNPQYKIKIANEIYFIWFNEDSTATIMNAEDTQIAYTVPFNEQFKEIITK